MIIYILTNEAMPGLVKIGVTGDDRLEDRIRELDTTALPLPFECFYAVKVGDEVDSIEKRVHRGLDDSRVRDKREFFRISPDQAKSLLSIAEAMGGVNVTPREAIVQDSKDTQAIEEARKKRGRFNFGMLGIDPETKLQFKKDKTIECEVVNETQINFRGEEMSLSAAALIVVQEMGYEWDTVQGAAYWCYHGKTLNDLRLEQEE
ncbi:MAG: GIY-YIG nuclease family protein [Parvularculales bacterium]